MKLPTIYVVTHQQGDKYHLFGVDLITWFFCEKDAENWARQNEPSPNVYQVEEVPGDNDSL